MLESFYSRREPVTMSDIFVHLQTKKKRKVRYLTGKLLELEILEKIKRKNLNYYVISRLGLDLFKHIEVFVSDVKITKALGMSQVIKALFAFSDPNDGISWSKLRIKTSLSESSLSRALNSLKDATLIIKSQENMYNLTKKGKEVKTTFSRLSDLAISPAYEIQVKIRVQSLSDILSKLELTLGVMQGFTIRQEDYYLFPKSRERSGSYLRYRIEQRLDATGRRVDTPKRTLSWTQKIRPISRRGIQIIRRKREDIEAPYPAILFILEYFEARIKHKIVKTRCTLDVKLNSDNVRVYLDEVKSIPKNRQRNFIEIKTMAKDEEEAEEKCDQILKLMNMLDLTESEICEKLYYELV